MTMTEPDESDPRISFASSWLAELSQVLREHGALMGKPHRTWDGEETLLEWWNADRKIAVSITHPNGPGGEGSVQLLWSWVSGDRHFVNSVDEGASPEIVALAWLWMNRPGATPSDTRHVLDRKKRCTYCGKMSRITTAGCDHCNVEDK